MSNATAHAEVYNLVIDQIIWSQGIRVIAKAHVKKLDASLLDRDSQNQGIDSARSQRRLITVIGDFSAVETGAEYTCTGLMQPNPKYSGEDLHVYSADRKMPTTIEGIQRYLTTTTKWIGPATATLITKKYGKDSIAVLRDKPELAAQEIVGLTPEKAREISESLAATSDQPETHIAIGDACKWQLSPRLIKKAAKRWGAKAPDKIKRTPYALCDLPGAGFKTADAVALALGQSPTCRRRQVAALEYAVQETQQSQGHTAIDRNMVIAQASALVGSITEDALRLAARSRRIAAENGTISDPGTKRRELAVVRLLSEGSTARPHPNLRIERSGLNDGQSTAVEIVNSARVSIITGGPGTGKTYTTARIVRSAIAAGLDVALCAPTGKAAKQMTAALGGTTHATTIHSLLEPSIDEETGSFSFARGPGYPLDADVVICDEFSMVSIDLAYSLVSAMPGLAADDRSRPQRLLIVGDRHQLLPVGPGAMLRDLIALGTPTAELTEIMRNAGRIVRSCHQIKTGTLPAPSPRIDLDAGENWRHIDADEPGEIKEIIRSLIVEKLPERGINPPDVQVLSSTNDRGPLSCAALNAMCKAALNPYATEDRLNTGDRVIRVKNGRVPDHKTNDPTIVCNGDIGYIEKINSGSYIVQFNDPARTVRIPKAESHLRLAYCVTCHKMQGSESPAVIIPLHRSVTGIPLVTREWLYTAFSRAKKIIVTVGSIKAIRPALSRIGTTQRRTWAERAEKIAAVPVEEAGNPWASELSLQGIDL